MFLRHITWCKTEMIAFIYFGAMKYPLIKRSEKEKYYLDVKNNKEELFPSLRDKCSVHLSVIIPAYEEEKRLPPMLDECLEFLEERQKSNDKFTYEVIVVNDGGKDKTPEVTWSYTEKFGVNKVRLLNLKPNRGKGGAVRMGVLSSRGAVILFADADGATKFSDLIKLEDSLKELIGYDYITDSNKAADCKAIVCASRSHLEEESQATRSLFRTFLMHAFHFLVWLFAVRTIRDTQCGFKLFTRETARILFSSIHVERWAFDVELLFIAEKLRVPISEVCVNWTEIDGSKIVPVLSWLQMGMDLVLIWLRPNPVYHESDYRDILAGPYLDPLMTDSQVSKLSDPLKHRKADDLYEKFISQFPTLKKKALQEIVDQSKITKEYENLGKSVYQMEFCKTEELKKLKSEPVSKKNTQLLKLPDDWVIPLSIQGISYRNLTRMQNEGLLSFEIGAKPFRPPPISLGFTSEEHKILHTCTGETEYEEMLGTSGRDIMKEAFYGEIKPLPREYQGNKTEE